MDRQSILFIIPTFNRKSLLQRAIDSVRENKSEKIDVFILIVNDCSTDGTAEQLLNYSSSTDTFYISLDKNSGVNKARQAGLEWALEKNFNWISFLDDDDRVTIDCVDAFLKALDKNSEENWIALPSIDNNGKRLSKFPSVGKHNYLIDYMGKRSIRGDFQHFVRTSALKGLSFSFAFKNGEVWYFWCNLAARCDMYIGDSDGVVKEYLVGGITQSQFNRDKKYRVAKYKMISLKKIMPNQWYAKIVYNYCRIAYKNKKYKKSYALAKKVIKLDKFFFKIYVYWFFSLIKISQRKAS